MTLVEKLHSLIILAAVLAGLALGRVPWLAQHAGALIVPFLMVMLTGTFLHVPLRRFGDAFRHRRVAVASLAINFLWTPLLGTLLGWLFLRDQPALWIGLLMLLVTPCTDWYLVFTGIARGNVGLSLALLPVNLVLQLVLLPVYLFLLAGTLVPLDWRLVLTSTAFVLLVPLLASVVLRRAALRGRGGRWLGRVLPFVESAQILFLGLAIAAMFASQGGVALQHPEAFLRLLPPLLLFFAVNLGLGLLAGRRLGAPYEDVVSLCCTTLARNSPIALAIAVVAFPEQPLIPVTLVIGPLIELPTLATVSQILLWIGRRGLFPLARVRP
jgi:ACR3 family arsenite efflux pump ArsB